MSGIGRAFHCGWPILLVFGAYVWVRVEAREEARRLAERDVAWREKDAREDGFRKGWSQGLDTIRSWRA